MRELTVRIRFLTESLGNEKDPKTGKFYFQRSAGRQGKILFLASWHMANMKFAANMLGRHQDAVSKIFWDIELDAELRENNVTRCYYKKSANSRERWSTHESFVKGQIIAINCVVPDSINDDDFWSLMQIAGKYRGLSPWKPTQYGHYEVVSIRQRRHSVVK